MQTYPNTPTEAARIGWDRLPEYCEGDSSLPFVRHDTRRGVFVFTGDLESIDTRTLWAAARSCDATADTPIAAHYDAIIERLKQHPALGY